MAFGRLLSSTALGHRWGTAGKVLESSWWQLPSALGLMVDVGLAPRGLGVMGNPGSGGAWDADPACILS